MKVTRGHVFIPYYIFVSIYVLRKVVSVYARRNILKAKLLLQAPTYQRHLLNELTHRYPYNTPSTLRP